MLFVSEPPEVERRFREKAAGRTVSAKVWADAWLLAVAQAAEGVLVTLDKALGPRGARCLLPARGLIVSRFQSNFKFQLRMVLSIKRVEPTHAATAKSVPGAAVSTGSSVAQSARAI